MIERRDGPLHGVMLATVLVLIGCTVQPGAPGADEGTEADRGDDENADTRIVEMLRASARDWNAGDLDGFLDDYSAGEDLTFVGSGGLLRGIDEVRDRYRRTYWAPGAERDSLRFEDLEVRRLGDAHALAVGRYVLYRPAPADSVTATGWFSLVLRRGDDGWTIVHDHSS